MIIRMSVPVNKFNQFHKIVCEYNGRYVNYNPSTIGNFVYTNVSFDLMSDYHTFQESWGRYNSTIVETYSTQWWKRWYRRFKLLFKSKRQNEHT